MNCTNMLLNKNSLVNQTFRKNILTCGNIDLLKDGFLKKVKSSSRRITSICKIFSIRKYITSALLVIFIMAILFVFQTCECLAYNSRYLAYAASLENNSKKLKLDKLRSGQEEWYYFETKHFIIQSQSKNLIKDLAYSAELIFQNMSRHYDTKNLESNKIRLLAYSNKDEFLKGSPSQDAAGYAISSRNEISIWLGTNNVRSTLAHEINHILFLGALQGNSTSIPHWFIEGLAIFESQPGVEVSEIEKYALAQDLPEIVPGNSENSNNEALMKDYAQGYLIISFIVSEYGMDSLYEIIDKLQEDYDFNTAVLQSLGVSAEDLNKNWNKYAKDQIFYIWFLQLPNLVWYLTGFLFLLAGILAMVKKRRQLANMIDDEDQDEDEDFIEEIGQVNYLDERYMFDSKASTGENIQVETEKKSND